ncbi:MAG: PQQ-dependent sugar dehydrogenase [Planctomycetota bacterium]
MTLKLWTIVATTISICCASSCLSAQTNLPTGFVEEAVLQAGDDPATFAFSPNGHLYFGERIQGRLFVSLPDPTAPTGWSTPSNPFFSFDVPSDGNGNPRRHRSSGLRDIAFHPNFPNEPWVYAFFMRDQPRHNRVVRVRASASNPTMAVPGSLQVLIDLPFNNSGSSGSHNGGALEFGPDGKLYIATGDGWTGGDSVQTLSTWTGKVLRLNPDGSIPNDNPFFSVANGNFRAIYALGCRNPFSMSADPSDGTLFLNETIGPNKTNIYRVSAAANFEHQGFAGIGVPTQPFVAANNGGRINTGGAWYSPSFPGQTAASMPFPTQYQGSYFVAQWGGNDGSGAEIARVRSRTNRSVSTFASNVDHGPDGRPILTRVGPDGHLYYLATDYETSSGSIYRIRFDPIAAGNAIAVPTIEPNGGTFSVLPLISLDHVNPAANIRFTINGSEPTASSSLFSQPFALRKAATLRTRAFVNGIPGPVNAAAFEVGVDDIPPVAIAGPDFIWPRGQLVTLNGSASYDPDGDDAALIDNWVQTGGPALLPGFDGGDFLSYFNPARIGTYTFRLDASDASTTTSEEISIRVVPCLLEVLDGLAARWPLSEGTGSMAGDSSPGADHGTIEGARWIARGPRPRDAFSLDFDGQDDRVTIPEFDATGSALTVSLWIRPDGFGVGDARLLSKSEGTDTNDHDLMLSTIPDGPSQHVVRARLRTSGTTLELRAPPGNPLVAGTWQHVALVYNGTNLRLFQNGQLVAQRPMSGNLTFNPARLLAIGNQPEGAGSRPFDGRISNVRSYGRALTPTEIQLLASPDLGTMPSPCACADDLGGQSPSGGALVACTNPNGSRSLRIEGGAPGALAVLLVGIAPLNPRTRLGRGELVPANPLPVGLAAPINSTGTLEIPLPRSTRTTTLYVQVVYTNPGAVGFQATNGLALDF